MALPYRLSPVGFEFGTDRKGSYLKLRLENPQPYTYSITRVRYETEGSYSDRSQIEDLHIAPQCQRLIRFDVHHFWDLAFWVAGSRDSARKPLRRGLAMFAADWAPPFPWQAVGNKMAAVPATPTDAKCRGLVDQLFTSPDSVWRSREQDEVWPLRVEPNDEWSYFVAVRRKKSTLKTGPFLRCRGQVIERFYTGQKGSDWYDVAHQRSAPNRPKRSSSRKR